MPPRTHLNVPDLWKEIPEHVRRRTVSRDLLDNFRNAPLTTGSHLTAGGRSRRFIPAAIAYSMARPRGRARASTQEVATPWQQLRQADADGPADAFESYEEWSNDLRRKPWRLPLRRTPPRPPANGQSGKPTDFGFRCAAFLCLRQWWRRSR